MRGKIVEAETVSLYLIIFSCTSFIFSSSLSRIRATEKTREKEVEKYCLRHTFSSSLSFSFRFEEKKKKGMERKSNTDQ